MTGHETSPLGAADGWLERKVLDSLLKVLHGCLCVVRHISNHFQIRLAGHLRLWRLAVLAAHRVLS